MRRTKLSIWLPAASVVLIALLAAPAARAAAEPAPNDGDEAALADAADVVVDGISLFRVRGVTAYPAARRALAVADRIREIARDSSADPAKLTLADGEQYTSIMLETKLVMRVVAADAEMEGIDRRLLAEVVLNRIRESIAAYRAARTREALIGAGWRAALATALTALTLFVLWHLFRVLLAWVERRYVDRVKAVTIRSFEVLRTERIWSLVRWLLRLAWTASFLVLVVVYLRYALGLFPWTRGGSSQIDDWLLSPLAVLGGGLVARIPDVIFLAILFVITRYILRLIRLFFTAVGRGEVQLSGFDDDWAEPTYKIVRIAVIAFAIVVAYPYIPGSSSAAFQGVSIFIGVVFSLGSSSAISNVIAGYTMVYRRAFREGDLVKIGSVVGVVSQIRLQVTHLHTLKNEEVVIPNSTILGSEVMNYSTLAKADGLILHTTVGIGYETPWRQVEAMLLEAARRTEGVRKDPPPFVLRTALGDFAVTYQINVYCDDPRSMMRRYSDLHAHILDVFNEYGIQIMTPAYEGDPAEPKIVPRGKWHEPPALRP